VGFCNKGIVYGSWGRTQSWWSSRFVEENGELYICFEYEDNVEIASHY
jgi:hypothetical protein